MAQGSVGERPVTIKTTQSHPVKELQYGFGQVIAFWFLATLPLTILAWVIMPGLLPYTQFPPVLLYWFILLGGQFWLFILSLWIIRKEEGAMNWPAIRNRLWLRFPKDPKTGRRKARHLWRAFPGMFLASVSLGIGVVFLSFGYILSARFRLGIIQPLLRMPS